MKIMKKNKEEEFWPRLLQDKIQEKTNVKIDWDRYVDEDEAEGKDFDTGRLYLNNSFHTDGNVVFFNTHCFRCFGRWHGFRR